MGRTGGNSQARQRYQLATERHGFQRARTLSLQHGRKPIHLERKVSNGVISLSSTSTEGIVIFTQRSHHIRQRLQWSDDLFHQD